VNFDEYWKINICHSRNKPCTLAAMTFSPVAGLSDLNTWSNTMSWQLKFNAKKCKYIGHYN